MQISEKSKDIIDSCRFCWMCRHICPIGNATGLERNTARARALSLSLVARGAAELKGDIADNLYECALCGACTSDCATGYDPVKATREARLAAALDGGMPEHIDGLMEKIEKYGNIYGEKEIPDVLKKSISDLPDKADVQFFIGRDAAYRTPEKAAAAVGLLKKAGVSFTVDRYEPDSGYALDFLIGPADETRKLMEKTAGRIAEIGARILVCYDPCDAAEFVRNYKEYGVALGVRVSAFPAFLAELVADGRLAPEKSGGAFTFQDPPALARDLEDSDSARNVLAACGELKDMMLCGKNTVLAGNLIMNEYMPGVMRSVALRRWEGALGAGAETLVTACPAEYAALSAVRPDGVELITIEEAVLKCL